LSTEFSLLEVYFLLLQLLFQYLSSLLCCVGMKKCHVDGVPHVGRRRALGARAR
jgi:hypothetical protein